MMARLEQWQHENVLVGLRAAENPAPPASPTAATSSSRRKASHKKSRSTATSTTATPQKHKFPLSAKNVDVLRCSVTVPSEDHAKALVEMFSRLLHRKYPIVRSRNQYQGLSKKLSTLAKGHKEEDGPVPVPPTLWESGLYIYFVYRPRRYNQRKKVDQPATFSQLMSSPHAKAFVKQYMAEQNESGQQVATAALNLMSSTQLAGRSVGMVCELQILLEPFVSLGRIRTFPFRCILLSNDSYDINLRLDPNATATRKDRLAALRRAAEQEDAEAAKKVVAAEKSGVARMAMSLMFVAKMAKKMRRRRAALEVEMLKQLEQRKQKKLQAAGVGRQAKSPMSNQQRLEEEKRLKHDARFTYKSKFSKPQYAYRSRNTADLFRTPRLNPTLGSYVHLPSDQLLAAQMANQRQRMEEILSQHRAGSQRKWRGGSAHDSNDGWRSAERPSSSTSSRPQSKSSRPTSASAATSTPPNGSANDSGSGSCSGSSGLPPPGRVSPVSQVLIISRSDKGRSSSAADTADDDGNHVGGVAHLTSGEQAATWSNQGDPIHSAARPSCAVSDGSTASSGNHNNNQSNDRFNRVNYAGNTTSPLHSKRTVHSFQDLLTHPPQTLQRPQTSTPRLQTLLHSERPVHAFKRGDQVRVVGLQRSVELNGMTGTVTDWGVEGTYHVHLTGTESHKTPNTRLLYARNLVPARARARARKPRKLNRNRVRFRDGSRSAP